MLRGFNLGFAVADRYRRRGPVPVGIVGRCVHGPFTSSGCEPFAGPVRAGFVTWDDQIYRDFPMRQAMRVMTAGTALWVTLAGAADAPAPATPAPAAPAPAAAKAAPKADTAE